MESVPTVGSMLCSKSVRSASNGQCGNLTMGSELRVGLWCKMPVVNICMWELMLDSCDVVMEAGVRSPMMQVD